MSSLAKRLLVAGLPQRYVSDLVTMPSAGRFVLLIAFLVVSSGCDHELAKSEAEELIRQKVGESTQLTCYWTAGMKKLGDRRGRYVFGDMRGDGEPAGCFRRLEKAGVLSEWQQLDFVLGPKARFIDHEGGHIVAFECGTATLGRVHEPLVKGDEATVGISLERQTLDETIRAIEDAGLDAAGCNRSMPLSDMCQVHLKHRDGRWTIARFESPACAHLNR